MQLVRPALPYLNSYIAALKQGWSPDNLRGAERAADELAAIATDPLAFLEGLDDPQAQGAPITLPSGSLVPRIPGYYRWMWDGEFAGSINLRWQPGTAELPPHCLGHIGYAVVPNKQGRGYATQALALILLDAKVLGLPYVELTTDETNTISQQVILANGGLLFEAFTKPPECGGASSLRYRIALR